MNAIGYIRRPTNRQEESLDRQRCKLQEVAGLNVTPIAPSSISQPVAQGGTIPAADQRCSKDAQPGGF